MRIRSQTLSIACRIGAAVVAVLFSGCDSKNPVDPSPVQSASTTVTMTAAGLSSAQVSVAVNGTVTFINADAISHEIRSNPHPLHNSCPPFDLIGVLAPGQQGTTGPLTFAGACGYHDVVLEDTGAGLPFRGVVLVGTSDSTAPPPVGY